MPVRVVHLVAKTHLDLGFTALASEVEAQYLDDFFPRALATAAALRDRGGPERLVWTTGSWILHRALGQAGGARAAEIEAGVRAGDLAWHALPVTTHTELMDAPLFRAGLGLGQELDRRFGRATTAAKMTDVPGHTRSMVPLLAEAGVTFLHLGVNPAWPVPDVPPVFRWRSPDGAEVVVAYAAGGYGGELVVPGCDEALAFLHSGDNLGPPSADDVVAAHAALRSRYPGAEVRASTLDAFARALAASGAVVELPVVTSEIGDPWLFGAGSDPQKVAAYRDLLRSPDRSTEVDRQLLLVAEHTWGLDQKIALPVEPAWDDAALGELRAGPAGIRFEASWAEQRDYVRRAAQLLGRADPFDGHPGAWSDDVLVADDEPVVSLSAGCWRVDVSRASGAAVSIVHLPSGRILADHDHPLGLVRHQSFGAGEYERFYEQLTPAPEDEGWARRDNTKPGIERSGGRPTMEGPDAAWCRGVVVEDEAMVAAHAELDGVGAPDVVELLWSWDASDADAPLRLEVSWPDKPATRLPEATWVSFVPVVTEPERWEIDKLGQRISPLDVVRRGGRSLHAVGEGMHHDGPDGRLTIRTPDAPLVAPGHPNLLDADPPVPDLAGGWHVLLHDNLWGTNFPMWNEGPAHFRFTISVT